MLALHCTTKKLFAFYLILASCPKGVLSEIFVKVLVPSGVKLRDTNRLRHWPVGYGGVPFSVVVCDKSGPWRGGQNNLPANSVLHDSAPTRRRKRNSATTWCRDLAGLGNIRRRK